MIAAIKIRGSIDASQKIQRTIEDLNLDTVNKCIVFEENDSIEGMLNIAKDYITFGEISEETVEALEERKGEEISHGSEINLSPPTRGFRDTKKQVGQGGSLGKRENMDELVQKMV